MTQGYLIRHGIVICGSIIIYDTRCKFLVRHMRKLQTDYCDRIVFSFRIPRSPPPPICQSQTPSTAQAEALA